MILILSKNNTEKTTNIVIDYLKSYNVNFFRLNGSDLYNGNVKIDFQINNNGWSFVINYKNLIIRSEDVKAIWFRRNFSNDVDNILGKNKNLTILNQYLRSEVFEIYKLLEYSINDAFWLNTILNTENNKFLFLAKAKESKLLVPNSFVTNNNWYLNKQLKKSSFITKPCTNGFLYIDKNTKSFSINVERIKKKPTQEMFFPSFCQQEIVSEYELRVFYLCGKTYAIQINNKFEKNGEVDSRKVSRNENLRISKYELPKYLRNNIDVFMKKINLNSGSLDFIKTVQNEYYFLEVNPVGQIDNVSKRGYYNIEEDIAKLLYEKTKSNIRD
ncbi:MAG: hypothetical protein L3J23_08810 [Flavobacteriaceae bacterium]|nr:hypothetical protein [Flavobacteriaceae bacterium]